MPATEIVRKIESLLDLPFVSVRERNRWELLLPRLKDEAALKLLTFLQASQKRYSAMLISFNTKSAELRGKLENKALKAAEYGRTKTDAAAAAAALAAIENS